MTAAEYAALALQTRDLLYTNIRAALPVDTEMEKRKVTAGAVDEPQWLGSLVNATTKKIRIAICQLSSLTAADEERTAGGYNFKPSFVFTVDLFHDYEFGTDASNTQAAFESDSFLLQYALETSRSLPPKAVIDRYSVQLGHKGSAIRALHWAHAEAVINFREIRYEVT